MVGIAILPICVIPVEEDNHAGTGFKAVSDPLSPGFEPLHTVDTAGELRDNTSIDIAAFISTPAYKAGAPLHTLRKSVPAPIGFTAHIADLGFRYFHDQL